MSSRVRKTTAGLGNDYLYDLAGRVVTEVDRATGLVNRTELYAAGMHLGTYTNGATYFNHADWQGTERMRTDINGFPTEMCTNEPFGAAQYCQGNETSHHHFTGKEWDTETGFDYFGARYYAGGLGHWLTPDWDAKPVSVPYAHFGNPQSLNLYAYVGNNPLSTVDPDGHDQPLAHGTTCQSTPFCSGRGPFYGDMWIKVDPMCNIDPVRCGGSGGGVTGSMLAMANGMGDTNLPLMLAPEAQAGAAQQGVAQSQSSSQPTASSASDKRTDVMLAADSVPPRPAATEAAQFEMDYRIVPQANTMQQLQDNASNLRNDSATQANYSGMEVRLWESQRGGGWQWQGDPLNGHGHDVLNVFAQRADQRWYIDGKRVQLVVGKDSSGGLIKAWTVHVEIKTTGPQFSKID
jgi:RHS repeat-associated protein